MTDEKHSHNWPLIIIVVLCGFLCVAIFSALDQSRKRKEVEAKLENADSVSYHISHGIAIDNSILHHKNDSLLNLHALLRHDMLAYVERAANAWDREKNGYLHQIAALKIDRYTIPELDSAQFILYGASPNDSTHTIPLDYSRKLTGDALRLPIEQRMATRASEQLDSATGNYIRIIGSYKVDLETAHQVIKADEESLNGIMHQVGDMQGQLNDQGRKFRRQRRKERILEGLVIAGIIVLTL